MIKFIIPTIIVFLIVLFWEKINQYFFKKFKLKFNYKEMIMLDSYKNIIKVLNKKLKK